MLERMVRSGGYSVQCVRTPELALALVEESGPPDVLLTDVVLPGMNGPELAEKLSESSPDLRVLFMSGYPDHEIFRGRTLPLGLHFLQKPFVRQALLDKLQEL
jgi:CheY-like chemotaxis protein